MPSDDSLAQEYRTLQLQAMERLERKVDSLESNISSMAERLAKMEGQDNSDRLRTLDTKQSSQDTRLTRIETRGGIVTAGIAIFVSAVITFLVDALLKAPSLPPTP